MDKPNIIRLPTPEICAQLREKEAHSEFYPDFMLPESPTHPLEELDIDLKMGGSESVDLKDLHDVLLWVHEKFPPARNLPSEDQKTILEIVTGVIRNIYPRYDRHSLIELTCMLEDYIRPEMELFLEGCPPLAENESPCSSEESDQETSEPTSSLPTDNLAKNPFFDHLNLFCSLEKSQEKTR